MNKIFYQPKNLWFGDCMPFYKDGVYYLFHQRDTRKPKPLTDPFGWSLVTTTDFVHFTDFGEVIKKGEQNSIDQYIYAGSVFQGKEGLIALYTGHNRQAKLTGVTSEILMQASSLDGIEWEKEGEASKLVPQEGYDSKDWRDPFVIFDQERNKYILVLGARLPASKKKPTGRLVYFESDDLSEWVFKGDFWTPDEFNMVEMPEIFSIQDDWYLIFSEYSEDKITKYRIGDSLYGKWRSLKDEAFDGKAYYAARTVGTNETGRFLMGWVATKMNNDDLNIYDWGGALVPHEIIQREDKTLGVRLPETITNHFNKSKKINSIEINNKYAKEESTILSSLEDYFLLETQICILEDTKEFSMKLFVDEETQEGYEFTISMNKASLTFGKTPNYPWPQFFDKGLERPLNLEIGKYYDVQMIVDDTIAVLYINNTALSTRMYNKTGTALSFTVTEGAVSTSEIKYLTSYQSGF
ncbi:hypothetical protein [Oceanobacillus sojae]|uniref:hypothetical protein n=1 Tax=Oceanobacillus sojae TaxID=582851 RepID=UPI0021A5BB7F|nr:hypothetical protein [Oceanobacillus sojae]MCT1905239.1 hypothetical protein [Oceanobacillus sojae]